MNEGPAGHGLERAHRLGDGEPLPPPGLEGARSRQQHAGRFLWPAGRHALESEAAARRSIRASSTTRWTCATGSGMQTVWSKSPTPTAVIHTAAQPSHDLAAQRPFEDFDVNAGGTLNLLEAMRRHCPEAPLVHMSTNKVYGDAPNRIKLVDLRHPLGLRRSGVRQGHPGDVLHRPVQALAVRRVEGWPETSWCRSTAGTSDMPTCCLRGGCLTGPAHSGGGAPRLSRLPRQDERDWRHVLRLRLRGQAGPRQHPLARRGAVRRGVHRIAPGRRGLQHRRRPRTTPARFWRPLPAPRR